MKIVLTTKAVHAKFCRKFVNEIIDSIYLEDMYM